MPRFPVASLALSVLLTACGEARQSDPGKLVVQFTTSAGTFTVEAVEAWAPRGVARLRELVEQGFYTDVAAFRVAPGFVVQFGIHGDPFVNDRWRERTIPDDPVVESNRRGTLTYATAGANTRTTQLFINLADNTGLDSMGFAPIGRVVEGMDVVDRLFSGYGDGPPGGRGPEQMLMERRGNAYLQESFPKLDYIRSAKIL